MNEWGEGRGEGRADTNLKERKTRKDHGDVELLARLRISDERESCGEDWEGERQGDAVRWVNNVDVRENMVRKGRMNTLGIYPQKKKSLVRASARRKKVQKKDHVLQIYCGSPGEEEKF